jgi:hypothetical protein
MLLLANDPARRREQAARASLYASENTWQVRKEEYLRLVDVLVNNNGKASVGNRTTARKPSRFPENKLAVPPVYVETSELSKKGHK